MIKTINQIFVRIERLLSRNWYNPIATVYLNFRCLKLKQACKLPIAVFGRPKFLELGGKIEILGSCRRGMVRLNCTHPAAPSFQGCNAELGIRGTMIFHGNGQIDTGTKIFINSGGVLEFGHGFKVCDMVNIGCYGRIVVGDMTWIVHRCQVFDTNYHFIANIVDGVIPSTISPVHIGNNCWICNSTTIMGGAEIPDFTIVGSNSLINKPLNIPSYSLVAGTPAKLIKTGLRKIESIPFTMKLYKYYNLNASIYRIEDDIDERIFLTED